MNYNVCIPIADTVLIKHKWICTIKIDNSIAEYSHYINLPYLHGMRLDFSDLCFTKLDGTIIPHYVETYTSGVSANIWFKPNIAVPYVRIFYGNITCANTSNGNKTFELFDHFDINTIDTTKWVWNGGTGVIQDSYINLQSAGGTSEIKSILTFGAGYVTRFRYKSAHVNTANIYELIGSLNSPNGCWWKPSNYNTSGMIVENYNGSSSYTDVTATCGIAANTYYSVDLIRKSDRATWLRDGTQFSDIVNSYPTDNECVHAYTYGAGASLFIDYIYVRKYQPVEPTCTVITKYERNPCWRG